MNSFEPFEEYTHDAEQDQQGDGNLPSYDDLSAQHSPNSRCVQHWQWAATSHVSLNMYSGLVGGEDGSRKGDLFTRSTKTLPLP